MSLTFSSVQGAMGRKVTPVEGQLGLFGPEDEPDTTPEEPNGSTNEPERTEK